MTAPVTWARRLGLIALLSAAGVAIVVANTWEPDRQIGQLVSRWAPEPSAFLELDGMQVHLRDVGPRDDAQPILLLHGMASSLHTWHVWQTELSKQRRVITVDLPGFGLTGPSPQGDYRIDAYTRFVLRLLDNLGIKQATLGGNALGGEIAWQTANLAPDRVKRLILIDSDGYQPAVLALPWAFHVASTKGMRWVSERILPKSLVASSVRSVFGHPDKVSAEQVDRYFELSLRVGNRRALFQRMDQAQFGAQADAIKQVRQPTLVLWGDRDSVSAPENAQRFCADIRQCITATFPGLGHLPQEEDPAATLTAVRAFLKAREL